MTHYDYGFRIYNPAIGRFLSVDPRAGKYPGWSPYNYVLGNPILNIDPRGDTTRVYNLEGQMVDVIGDSYPNEEHFLSASAISLIDQLGLNSLGDDARGDVYRDWSSYFIGQNTRNQLKPIAELSESEGKERAYVLHYTNEDKELQVSDITNGRDRSSNHFDYPVGLDQNPSNVIVGHTHPTAGVIKEGEDPNDIIRVHTPTPAYRHKYKDFSPLLTGSTKRAYPQLISSKYGYNIYSSIRETPDYSSHPYPMQILNPRGVIMDYSGIKIRQ